MCAWRMRILRKGGGGGGVPGNAETWLPTRLQLYGNIRRTRTRFNQHLKQISIPINIQINIPIIRIMDIMAGSL